MSTTQTSAPTAPTPDLKCVSPRLLGGLASNSSAQLFPGDCFPAREPSDPRACSLSWGDRIQRWVRRRCRGPGPGSISEQLGRSIPAPELPLGVAEAFTELHHSLAAASAQSYFFHSPMVWILRTLSHKLRRCRLLSHGLHPPECNLRQY